VTIFQHVNEYSVKWATVLDQYFFSLRMFLGILQKKDRVWSNYVQGLSLCDVLLCSALSFPNMKAYTPAVPQLVLSPSTMSQHSRPTALDATSYLSFSPSLPVTGMKCVN
jgi:hypothetical protein